MNFNFNFVKVSPKFQIVIPKNVREEVDLKVGAEIAVIPFDGRIELVLIGPIEEARGILKGIDTTIIREPDREL